LTVELFYFASKQLQSVK